MAHGQIAKNEGEAVAGVGFEGGPSFGGIVEAWWWQDAGAIEEWVTEYPCGPNDVPSQLATILVLSGADVDVDGWFVIDG